MSVLRIDLEVKDAGSAQVVQHVSGQLKDLGNQAKASQAVLTGMFQGVGQAAFHALEEIPKLFVEMGHAVVEFATHSVEHLMHVVHALEGFMAKTGLGAQSAQELGIAMKIAGGDSDTLAGMIGKMQKNLVAGSGAFAALGLDVKKLKNEDPAKAFTEIAERIREIKNPTEQAAAMMAVFGKSGTEAARLIKEGVGELVEDAHHLGGVLGDEDVRAAAELGKEARRLSIAWEAVQNQFAAALISSPELRDILLKVTEALASVAHWVHENRGAMQFWIGSALRDLVLWLQTLWAWLGKVASKSGLQGLLAEIQAVNKAINDQFLTAEAVRLAKEALAPKKRDDGGGEFDFNPKGETAAQKMAKLREETMGKVRVQAIQLVNAQIENEYKRNIKVVEQILDTGADQEKQIAQHRAEIYRTLANQLALGQKNAQVWREMEARQLDLGAAKWSTYGTALTTVAQAIHGPVGDALSGLGGTFEGLAAHQHQAADNLRTTGSTAMTTGQKMQGLATTILAVAAAFDRGKQSGDKFGSTLSGAASGAAAGAAFGPYGAVIGAVVGGTAGYLGAAAGQKKQLQDLRAEYVRLWNEAVHAGVVFQHTFDPKTPKQFKDAIDEINRALDVQAKAAQALQEAVERYGFTIDELGPAFAAQELDKKMAQIYQDWMLLKTAGVDHEAMLNRIGPEVGNLVDQYIAGGIEIPKAMKGIIEDLYEHHRLLHANGEEYTEAEYKALTYGETTSQMFQDLIEKLQEFIDAINAIVFPDKVLNVNEHYHPDPNHPNGGGGDPWPGPWNYDGSEDHDGDPTNSYAWGGNFRTTGRMKMIVGEAGPEDVSVRPVRPGGGGGLGGGGNGGGLAAGGVLVLEIDGQQFRGFLKRKERGGYLVGA